MPRNKSKKAGTARTSAKRNQQKKGSRTPNTRQQAMQLRKQFAPVATGAKVSTGSARFQNVGSKGDIRVSHSEYVCNIPGSTAFASTAYAINAGNPIIFPWLAQIASRFESYRFNSLTIRLLTRAPTSTGGIQVLAVDYDAVDPAPLTMAQARSYRSSVAGAPWEDITFQASKEDLSKEKSNFIRIGAAVPTGTDIRLYDIGNLFVITDGQAATTVISELVVSYDITLMTPQLTGFDGLCARESGTAGLTASVLFGTDSSIDPQSSLPVSVNAAGDTMTFQTAGTYLIVGNLTGTVFVATSFGNTGTVLSYGGGAVTNAAATSVVGWTYVDALPGQTWKPTITSCTTCTAIGWRIASFDKAVFA